jgi:uncharacterized membrane protein
MHMMRLKRFFKHRWANEQTTRQQLPTELLLRLQQRVAASEQRHSGEIRICVETSLPLRYLYRNAPTATLARQRALEMFATMGIWDTANNNGVLIYLLAVEHAIEVVADRGLNSWMDATAWNRLVTEMGTAFKRGDYEGGLTHALEEVSAVLVQHFPLGAGEVNPNELPDAPIIR